MDNNSRFAAEAYQARTSRRELSVELAFRIRDLQVKESKRQGSFLTQYIPGLRSNKQSEDTLAQASSLLKVFASKADSESDGLSAFGAGAFVEVYSSEIQAQSENPTYNTNLLLDIPIRGNLAVPTEIYLRFELYISTKASANSRKFVLHGQASITLREVFEKCGYTDFDDVVDAFENNKSLKDVHRKNFRQKGWGAISMETVDISNNCLLDIRVIKSPRLISVEVPVFDDAQNSKAKVNNLPWRSPPPLHPNLLVGAVHAPISRSFTIEMDPNTDNFNSQLYVRSTSRSTSRSTTSRYGSRTESLARHTRNKKLATEFVDFREEMSEIPMGLLLPSLYLQARASEIGKIISDFKAEVKIEIAMVAQRIFSPEDRKFSTVSERSASSLVPAGLIPISGTNETELKQLTAREQEAAIAKHNAWATGVVDHWKDIQKQFTELSRYYKTLWENCTGATYYGHHKRRSTAKSHHLSASRFSRSPNVQLQQRHLHETDSASSNYSDFDSDLITTLKHTSKSLALSPNAPVFVDSFMGGGGGASFSDPPLESESETTNTRPGSRKGSKSEPSMDITFRSSTERQNWRLRHLPINLHLQLLTVNHSNVHMAKGSGFNSQRAIIANNGRNETRRRTLIHSLANLKNRGKRAITSSRGQDYVEVVGENENTKQLPDEADVAVFSEPVAVLPRGTLRPVRSHEKMPDKTSSEDVQQTFRHSTRRRKTRTSRSTISEDKPERQYKPLQRDGDAEQEARKTAKYYESVTVGATAAHHLGFDHGGIQGVLELEKIRRMDWNRMRDLDNASIEHKLEAARKWHNVQLEIFERQDTVYPQALSAVTSAIISRLFVLAAYGSKHDDKDEEDDEREEHQAILEHGFLIGWESLLSTRGKELGMLQDLADSVQWLTNSTHFRIIASRDHANITESSLHRIRTHNSKSMFVSGEAFKGAAERAWLVTIKLPRGVVRRLPPTIRAYVKRSTLTKVQYVKMPGSSSKVADLEPLIQANCKPLRVNCLLFTQGINEQQSIAIARSKATIGSKSDTIQEKINLQSVEALGEYCSQRFRTYVPFRSSYQPMKKMSDDEHIATVPLDSGSTTSATESTVGTDEMFAFRQAQAQRALFLLANLKNAVGQQASTEKNLKILTISADLVRWLNGIRLCSCKSAKDRTSMSATLEEARLLVGLHNVRREDMLPIANAMREHGVRLINVYKNTKNAKYAFNGIQRAMLPLEYKPPASTIGGMFRIGNAT